MARYVREQLPDLEIDIWPEAGNIAGIEYLGFLHSDFGTLATFPNLKAMFSHSAGVGSFVRHSKLPKAPCSATSSRRAAIQ
jgi:glyoxylate/hydroxypyruvate reductase A